MIDGGLEGLRFGVWGSEFGVRNSVFSGFGPLAAAGSRHSRKSTVGCRGAISIKRFSARKTLDSLRRIAARGGIKNIPDPARWQREIRQDRPLPGREE